MTTYVTHPKPRTRLVVSGPPTTSRMSNYYGTVATVLEASDDGHTVRVFDGDREWTVTRHPNVDWRVAGDDLGGPPLVPGDPVAYLEFSKVTGHIGIRRLFMRDRGPHAGDYIGGVDAEAGSERNACCGHLARRRIEDVRDLVRAVNTPWRIKHGWRVVDLAEAATALQAAGFELGNDRSLCHLLYADEVRPHVTWRKGDGLWHWNAFVVPDIAPSPTQQN